MKKIDRQLARLFQRVKANDNGVQSMPDDYIKGWYAGYVLGRDTQRKSDIEVAQKLLINPPHLEGE